MSVYLKTSPQRVGAEIYVDALISRCVIYVTKPNKLCLWSYPTKVTSDLFDIMSGQTDVDHPLCEECTDTLLDHLDTQLNITENECQNYKWAGAQEWGSSLSSCPVLRTT